jgi:hypothetical protein
MRPIRGSEVRKLARASARACSAAAIASGCRSSSAQRVAAVEEERDGLLGALAGAADHAARVLRPGERVGEAGLAVEREDQDDRGLGGDGVVADREGVVVGGRQVLDGGRVVGAGLLAAAELEQDLGVQRGVVERGRSSP